MNKLYIELLNHKFTIHLSGLSLSNYYHITTNLNHLIIPKNERILINLDLYNPYRKAMEIIEIWSQSYNLKHIAENYDSYHRYYHNKYHDTNVAIKFCKPNNDIQVTRLHKYDNNMHNYWNVLPKQRQRLIKIPIIYQKSGIYQGFIRIKTSLDILYIPYTIKVLDQSINILHSLPLNFGTFTRPGQSNYLIIDIENSSFKDIKLHNIINNHVKGANTVADDDFTFSFEKVTINNHLALGTTVNHHDESLQQDQQIHIKKRSRLKQMIKINMKYIRPRNRIKESIYQAKGQLDLIFNITNTILYDKITTSYLAQVNIGSILYNVESTTL